MQALENLVKIGQLKTEPLRPDEVTRMLAMANTRLADALRLYGFRSENRFTVFQCLSHTIAWPAHKWRVLDLAHQKRNLAEYEGYLEVEESGLEELINITRELIDQVSQQSRPK